MAPARRVVTRSPHRSVGVMAVPWLQAEPIEHESFLERDFVDLAVICRVVRRIDFQPFKLDYRLDTTERSAVPDYLVTLTSGARLVVEIKPDAFVESSRTKFDAIASVLDARGMPYYVVTDVQLGREAVAQARLWRRYARAGIDDTEVERTMAAISGDGSTKVSDLLADDVPLAVLYHLLGRRRLLSADRFALTPETRLLRLEHEECSDERVYFDSWFGCSPWGKNVAPRT